jgi:uncharacterized membrane protein
MEHLLDSARNASRPAAMPQVRKVEATRPLVWLRRGAADLLRAPAIGLGTGALVAALGWLLVATTWKALYLAPALLGGFLLAAPFIAIGLYAVSRQLEQGQSPDAKGAWLSWRGNGESVALFGLLLALACIAWERTAAIVFAFFYTGEALTLSNLLWDLLAGRLTALAVTFTVAGGLLAALVFALGVVSAPLLIERPVDVVTATLTSLRCCAANPAAMLVWAALIAGLTMLGFATLMLGLVVVFPLLAFASWHACRDLVRP